MIIIVISVVITVIAMCGIFKAGICIGKLWGQYEMANEIKDYFNKEEES